MGLGTRYNPTLLVSGSSLKEHTGTTISIVIH